METRAGPLTVFVHIPKTGGTTFRSILEDNFPPGAVGRSGNVFGGQGGTRTAKLAQLQRSGHIITRPLDLLSGHIPLGLRPYLPDDSRYVTFLREPVDRMLSHFYSLRELGRVSADDSPEAAFGPEGLLVDNLQTRMLSGVEEPFGAVTQDMLEQAKENLHDRVLAFGLTERFDESLVLMRRRLGLASLVYIHHRPTTRPIEPAPVEVLRLVEDSNRYDIDLYAWAAQEFDALMAEQDVEFRLDLAALRRALGARDTEPELPSPRPDAEQLLEMLLVAKQELFERSYELAETRRQHALDLESELCNSVRELGDRIALFEDRVGSLLGRSIKGPGLAAEKLVGILAQIEQLETVPEHDRGAGADAELARLRARAARLRERAEPGRAPGPVPDEA